MSHPILYDPMSLPLRSDTPELLYPSMVPTSLSSSLVELSHLVLRGHVQQHPRSLPQPADVPLVPGWLLQTISPPAQHLFGMAAVAGVVPSTRVGIPRHGTSSLFPPF